MRHEAREWLRDRRPALYIRESTARQGNDDRFGPEIQRHAHREAIERYGMREPVRTYTDLVSGSHKGVVKRSDFRQMMADARAKVFDVLLVYDVSRFMRDEVAAWKYLDELQQARIPVYFCDEDILTLRDEDWKDRIGDVINTAASYSRRMSRNIRRALDRKWVAGGQAGRAPFGYSRGDSGIPVPNEDAPTRALCFTLYASGDYSYETLAAELNSRGLRIFGGPFTRSALREMFINPIVIGTLRRNMRGRREGGPEIRENAVTPIVDRATWDRVQRLHEDRGKHRRGVRSDRYVFSGVARCRDCGSGFWGHNAGSGKYRYRRIEHRPPSVSGVSGTRYSCSSVHHESILIATFEAFLAQWTLTAEDRARAARYLDARGADASTAVRRKQLDGELARLGDLYRWEHIEQSAYLEQRRDVERRIAALPAAPEPPTDDAVALIGKIGALWAEASDVLRRRFVDECFEEIRLGRDRTLELIVRPRYRELVFAAYGQGRMTEPSHPHPYAITLAGYDEWLAFWDAEATA